MTQNLDPNAWLMAGGVTSAKFPTIGTRVTGRISSPPVIRQQTDPADGRPKTWDNGDPMMQLVVNLTTTERDPSIPNDDGVRAVYIKGQLQQAVREAVRRSGAPGLEVGGTLTVTYTGDGERKKAAFNAPKEYSAQYVPATTEAANTFLGTQAAAPQAAAAPAAQPVTPPVVTPPPAPNQDALAAALANLPPAARAAILAQADG